MNVDFSEWISNLVNKETNENYNENKYDYNNSTIIFGINSRNNKDTNCTKTKILNIYNTKAIFKKIYDNAIKTVLVSTVTRKLAVPKQRY